MDAKVENRDGIFVVSLIGQMDFESADTLKSQCLEKFAEKKIIFNLQDLSFVGSSGITPFLELLTTLSKKNGQSFKICAVRAEFMRLFESSPVDGIEIYRDVKDAERAFSHSEAQALARIKPFGLKLTID